MHMGQIKAAHKAEDDSMKGNTKYVHSTYRTAAIPSDFVSCIRMQQLLAYSASISFDISVGNFSVDTYYLQKAITFGLAKYP